MQFVYDKNAKKEVLHIKDENYRYLFKVKRLKTGDMVNFRNLIDDTMYLYKIEEVDKKEARAILKEKLIDTKQKTDYLHLLWCMVDTKIIEKTLPQLNQLGVSKISFLYCERSQKNFKLDLKRVEKILINSSQQCGRANLMEIEILNSLENVLQKYDNFSVLDFGRENLDKNSSSIMIGCEGGFTKNEKEKLKNHPKIGLNTKLILKSETAILAISSKHLI